MNRKLPKRPSLEHLKRQAKELLAAAKAGDADSRARFAPLPERLALHDAQLVIARDYGFASWPKLKAHVESCAAEALAVAILRAEQSSSSRSAAVEFPSLIPFLALRDRFLGVGAVIPFNVADPIARIALKTAGATGGTIAVFASRAPAPASDRASRSTPAPVFGLAPGSGLAPASALHDVGVVARVRMVGGTVLLHAVAWVRLEDIEASGLARVATFPIDEDECPRVDELRQLLAAKVEVLSRVGLMVANRVADTPIVELADAAMSNAACSVAEKAAYAAETRLSRRIELVLSVLGPRAG